LETSSRTILRKAARRASARAADKRSSSAGTAPARAARIARPKEPRTRGNPERYAARQAECEVHAVHDPETLLTGLQYPGTLPRTGRLWQISHTARRLELCRRSANLDCASSARASDHVSGSRPRKWCSVDEEFVPDSPLEESGFERHGASLRHSAGTHQRAKFDRGPSLRGNGDRPGPRERRPTRTERADPFFSTRGCSPFD
jgi:hypothetical protein